SERGRSAPGLQLLFLTSGSPHRRPEIRTRPTVRLVRLRHRPPAECILTGENIFAVGSRIREPVRILFSYMRTGRSDRRTLRPDIAQRLDCGPGGTSFWSAAGRRPSTFSLERTSSQSALVYESRSGFCSPI